jgi:glutamine synthetase
MRDDSFSAIDDLIRQAEQAAAAKPNQVRLVAELVGLVADRGADPYLLIGALVEGAVDTIAKHIPPKRRMETTERLGRLLVERLKARGLA